VAPVAAPEISVVVPSHSRRLRLLWLLNAMESQTLARDRWELIVATTNEDLAEMVRGHPVGARHVLPHASGPAAQRNAGWRAAQAPLILFTDDDCRPDEHWVERMLAAARAHPGQIVQGATRPDPFEWAVGSSPHARTLNVIPPGPFAQTCNILYPRDVLDRCGGFDEAFPGAAGEDLDLALRARALGVGYAGAPGALVFHAVEAHTLLQAVRMASKWGPIAYLVKQHPELRREHRYPLGVFWRRTHFHLVIAVAGALLALAARRPLFALLVLPYLVTTASRRGTTKRELVAGLLELPGRSVVDAAELIALARASAEHRTLVL
jgi:GT2 family glycosyltransferase